MTDGGNSGDGDNEGGGGSEQEGGENKEKEDANNRRNRSSTGRRPLAENTVAVSPIKGNCLYNQYPYLVTIQTPVVVQPPPRSWLSRGRCAIWLLLWIVGILCWGVDDESVRYHGMRTRVGIPCIRVVNSVLGLESLKVDPINFYQPSSWT